MSALFSPYATYCFNCGSRFAAGEIAYVIFGPGTELCSSCSAEAAERGVRFGETGAVRKRENTDILAAMDLLDEDVERVTYTEVEA